ncbi:hypothetical protein PGT21_006744 [Puccinia graminis f. sp. tritici]|uniref:Uncharacterized protein n=1 Tax=Puccinia graminis f. sp. tritici TaxID=56615 RepID=A0A5B0NVK6_PUCGR|nr:hypothetical protein PGT21_006744 [Puccinia graminis f. sp. tritici]KAA1093648.1 hypothetical protein PGTUg99_015332 [Puccinia graminis f. sp. tritici]
MLQPAGCGRGLVTAVLCMTEYEADPVVASGVKGHCSPGVDPAPSLVQPIPKSLDYNPVIRKNNTHFEASSSKLPLQQERTNLSESNPNQSLASY